MRRVVSTILLGVAAISFLGDGGLHRVAAQVGEPVPVGVPDVATLAPSSAPTPTPATPTAAPVVPTDAPSPSPFPEEEEQEGPEEQEQEQDGAEHEDEDDEPDVVIDLQVTGLTQEQVEAVSALVKYLQSVVHGKNGSKVEAHVEWKGEHKGHKNETEDEEAQQEREKKTHVVADTAGTSTALLSTVTVTRRHLRQEAPRDRPSVPEEGLQNTTATLCDLQGYNITSITLHGNSDKAFVAQIIKLLTGGSTHLSIHAGA